MSILFQDGNILFGNARNNRFLGFVRHFDEDGNLAKVTNADKGTQRTQKYFFI